MLGPSSNSAQLIPPSEIVSGDLALADRRLREGGWSVLSRELAAEHNLHVGQAFTLPSPEPMTFRVAALSTNLGWPPGAVIVNSKDYARAWASSDPSGFEIDLQPGVSAASVRHEIQAALGSHTGLEVETAGEREQRHYALARQGLLRLTQIRFLVLIAAMLAIAGALGSLIWQRRGYVAFVRALGFKRPVLRRWLLLEGLVLLGVGCLTGALFGVYGQLLMSHALASVTGFPISFNVEALVALTTLAVVITAVVVVVSMAGLFHGACSASRGASRQLASTLADSPRPRLRSRLVSFVSSLRPPPVSWRGPCQRLLARCEPGERWRRRYLRVRSAMMP